MTTKSTNATIISTSSVKGGIGKSCCALNFGAYEASHHRKVLFIDMDAQCNMTMILGHQSKKDDIKKSSIIRAFNHDSKNPASPFPTDFTPVHVNKYIDLIAGANNVKNIEDIMSKRKNVASFVVAHVIMALHLQQKYDFIIIDTHNSFKLPTINALIPSDYIFSPVTPNLFSLQAMGSMMVQVNGLRQNYYDIKTGKSDINAKLLFIGNMVENTKASKEFVKYIKTNKQFIACFKKRELINKAINNYQSIYNYAKHDSKAKKIIKSEINPEFKKMDKVINKNK